VVAVPPTSEIVHTVAAAAAFAAALVATAATLGHEAAARAAWRDYVSLTKPRIMSLLLLTGLGGMFVGIALGLSGTGSSSSRDLAYRLAPPYTRGRGSEDRDRAVRGRQRLDCPR